MNLDYQFLGNSMENYLLSILIISMGFVLKKNFSKYISKFLFDFILRTKNLTGNDFYLTVKKPLDYLVILVFSYLSISQIDLSIILNNFILLILRQN